MFDALFGNATATKVLFFFGSQPETYAQAVADGTHTSLSLVQAQLKRLERGGVLTSRLQGRMRFYSLSPRFPLRAELAVMLARAEALASAETSEEHDDHVRNALFTLGAPTFGEEVEVPDVERALVDGVELAHRDGTVASVLPVVLFKQRDRADVDKLLKYARERGEDRALGMFLDVAAQLSSDQRLSLWATFLRTEPRKLGYFFASSNRSAISRVATKKNTPDVAKRWGWWLNMGFDAFESMFRKHAHA